MGALTAAATVHGRPVRPRPAPGSLGLLNVTTDEPLSGRVELALTRRARRRGLLGRQRLEPGAALVLVPCVAVHTAFMKFAIDVVFVSRVGRVVHVVERMQPWRMAIAPGAYGVIELAAGSLARLDVRIGDRLCLVRADVAGDEAFDFEQVQQCLDARAS